MANLGKPFASKNGSGSSSNHGSGSSGSGGGQVSHRPSSVSRPAHVHPPPSSAFVIHEDTQFLPSDADFPPASTSAFEDDTGLLAGPMPLTTGTHMSGLGAGGVGVGLAIYEDTQFLPGMGQQQQLGGYRSDVGRMPIGAPMANPLGRGVSGGIIHEDTEFVTRDIVWNRGHE